MSPTTRSRTISPTAGGRNAELSANIPGLRVAGRTSAFQFKGRNEDLRVIGEKLNVTTVLEGSVRKEGHRVRITAQLIKVNDGFHLWSETYDRGAQRHIRRAGGDCARGGGVAEGRAAGRKDSDAVLPRHESRTVQRLFTGTYLPGTSQPGKYGKGARLLRAGHQVGPRLCPGMGGAGNGPQPSAYFGYVPFAEGFRKGRTAAEQALAHDRNVAGAHAEMGLVQMASDWDWAGADASFKRALTQEPGT